jgi:Zn-dependent protease
MDFVMIIFSIIILIVSIIFHELAHGTVADWLGDPTARLAGRLTLNPVSHMEWLGSVILPLLCIISGSGFIIGWAKPVPFNEKLLKYKRFGPALVAFAGPLMNIIIALCAAAMYHLAASRPALTAAAPILVGITMINISLAVFNLLPIPPLDGHHIIGALFPKYKTWSQSLMGGYGFVILIAVIFFAGSFITPVVTFFSQLLLM